MNVFVTLCLFLFVVFVEGGFYYIWSLREKTLFPTIVDGQRAKIKLFPWLAVLRKYKEHHCGGVVVSDRVILTAADCVFEEGQLEHVDLFTVLLGSTAASNGAQYRPCHIKPHPEYNPFDRDTHYYNNLALILVDSIIRFNRHVQKAHLVPHNDWRQPRSTFILAGYGYTETEGSPSDSLQMTTMSYISNAQCNSSKSSDGVMPVPNSMFCLVSDRASGDCYGDTGSGVMWGGFVVGIITTRRSYHCGVSDIPSMHTSVYHFRDWIQHSIYELESGVHGCLLERIM